MKLAAVKLSHPAKPGAWAPTGDRLEMSVDFFVTALSPDTGGVP